MNEPEGHSILDAISYSQQSEALRTFDPHSAVAELLEKLPARERQVVQSRYGLLTGESQTLEVIGSALTLTRERIRQIEKDALKKLRSLAAPPALAKGVDLIFQFIEERGNVARESEILSALLISGDTPVMRQNLLFVLSLEPQFRLIKDSVAFHQSWALAGFDHELLERIAGQAAKILSAAGQPMSSEELISQVKTGLADAQQEDLSNIALESYISVSRTLSKNPYGEWGLAAWPQISPKDVGDKAYLILSHHKQPEHYAKITEMINKQGFDRRTAHKESVHNELIKDKRFVLVGRGIYALSEWGYNKGVVADIIRDVIAKAEKALSKEEIVSEVLKQRVVKRNTIIVGLSNKAKFQKNPENKYLNVQ